MPPTEPAPTTNGTTTTSAGADQEQSPDYLQRRIETQRKWHSSKAAWNKRWYYTLEIATLAAGALIPLVNVWAAGNPYWAGVWSTIFGVVVVVSSGISKLFKFQENWLQYRAVAEKLGSEVELFRAGVGDYAALDADKRNALLVERTESYLGNVTTQFIATHQPNRAGEGEVAGD